MILWRKESNLIKEDIILQEVIAIRRGLSRVGTRKLLYLIQNKLRSHVISFWKELFV